MRSIVALACLVHISNARRVSSLKTNERHSPGSLETFLLATSPMATPQASSAWSSPRRSQTIQMAFPHGGLPPRGVSASPAHKSQVASPFSKLQNFNQEMVDSMNDLRRKREDFDRQILVEEEERRNAEKRISALKNRMRELEQSLEQKAWQRGEYDKTIQQTEEAYMKIVKDSQNFLQTLKRKSVNLSSQKKARASEETRVKKNRPTKDVTVESQAIVIEDAPVLDEVAISALADYSDATSADEVAMQSTDLASSDIDDVEEANEDDVRAMTMKAIS